MKGLSGGKIILRQPNSSKIISNKNVIAGNVCLYGATSGKFFAAGKVGDRFCVRNSGAHTVIEGCGDNGCEYMTGGIAVILGPVGNNFAAGMTGGMAFVYDRKNSLSLRINSEEVVYQNKMTKYWEGILKNLIQEHYSATNSLFAKNILDSWIKEKSFFLQIIPKEMINKFEKTVLIKETKTA